MDLMSRTKQTLPSRNRVRSHDWAINTSVSRCPPKTYLPEHLLRSRKIQPLILGRASLLINQLQRMLRRDLVEVRLVMRGRQAVGKAFPHWRETIIRFVARGPERVAADVFRGLDNLQDGVVGGNAFERDTFLG